MARIRTIKPEFFTSEDIVAISPLARLLYIALWCEADREGRLCWKPRTFKIRYLPADDCDINALCKELTDSGMVKLYGDALAYIPSFGKHQHLNPREAASTLPEPTRGARVKHASPRDSDTQGGREGKGKEGENIEPTVLVGSPSAPRLPACPSDEIVTLYHEHLPMLPRVDILSDGRKRALSARWRDVVSDPAMKGKDDIRREGLDWFAWYFGHAATSKFLTGKSKDWRADFDFLVTPQKFVKVCEGHYHKEAA
jgi:hypothetical protein